MLILTRRISESIVIGDHLVTIQILGIKGNQVRIGFTADKNLPIHREEIFERIENDRSLKN